MAEQVTTASGLQYVDEVVGDGASPTNGQNVKVHYTGTFPDGRKFDSSRDRSQPFQFVIGQGRVIPGWTEGVGLMVKGEKRRLWIPQELAYKGRPGAPAGMLVFDVELLGVG